MVSGGCHIEIKPGNESHGTTKEGRNYHNSLKRVSSLQSHSAVGMRVRRIYLQARAVSVRPGTLPLDLSGGRITARCSHGFLLYPGATHSLGDKQEPARPAQPHVSEKTGFQCRKLTPGHKHLPQAPHSTRVEDGSLLIKTECFAFKIISGSQRLLEQKAYFMRI